MIASSTDSGALRLHHVGHAIADLAAAALAYRERFGYRQVSPPIHDPLQTAHVQFLRLGEEPAMLELVAPDGPDSKLAAFVRKGGGLHHLCYTCEGLQRSIDRLAATGLRLISDPKPAKAFDGRNICWLLGPDRSLIELVERHTANDMCLPAVGDCCR